MAKLTTDEFAESVKTKYPQYKDVDNATLTTKMLEKYPQYSEKVETGTPTVSEPKKGIIGKIGSFLAPTATNSINKLRAGEGIGLRDIAGSALEIGSLALPATAGAKVLGLGTKALKGISAARKIGSAATTGAIAGGMSGAGRSIGEGGGINDVATSTAGGAILGGATGAILPVIPGLANKAKTVIKPVSVAEKQAQKGKDILETAGRVVQGESAEQKIGAKVLGKLDTEGVETYEQLSQRLKDQTKKRIEGVESEFAKDMTPRKLSELSQKVEVPVGDRKIVGTKNYVSDALSQLGKQYRSTLDLQSELRIKGLQQKAKSQGLTGGEINELAKEHGRVLTGFDANNKLASGLSKQASENTRKGLKDTARGFLKTDKAKNLDKEASEFIRVQELVDDMVEKVNKLQQKVEKRGLLQKVGRGIGAAVDVGTGGLIKALGQKLLVESDIGNKSANALRIQENLQKNLKLLKKLNSAPKSAIPKMIKDFMEGAKSSVGK